MANAQVYFEAPLLAGKPVVWESLSPEAEFGVVFEDDGAAAYFHAVQTGAEKVESLDSLLIYEFEGVEDKEASPTLQIVWSDDGMKAALLIDGYAHAVFDFIAQRGYCRTNLPKPNKRWTRHGHRWNDAVVALFE